MLSLCGDAKRSERRGSGPMEVMSDTKPVSVVGFGSTKEVVDLESIVRAWAKQIFDVTKTKEEARISKRYLQYNINWAHVFVESLDAQYTVFGVDSRSVNTGKAEQVLFKSTFTNSTDREQEYSFKTERCTRSSVCITVEKGVCRGVDMEVKLKTPCEVAEATSGFHNEVSVTHIGENTVEEELSWGVDSTVTVPPQCETAAELIILEDQHLRNFSIENRMSGKVIVTVTNLKENNSLVTIIEGKIADIIRGVVNHTTMGFTVVNDVVSYTTKGTCRFKFGVEQIVRITEKGLGSQAYNDF